MTAASKLELSGATTRATFPDGVRESAQKIRKTN
jgi:hypothetical protein